jgi:hypothetical protein
MRPPTWRGGRRSAASALVRSSFRVLTGDVFPVAPLPEESAAHIVDPLPPDEEVVTESYCLMLGAAPTLTVYRLCAAI